MNDILNGIVNKAMLDGAPVQVRMINGDNHLGKVESMIENADGAILVHGWWLPMDKILGIRLINE